MKQILQNLKNGNIELTEIPYPLVRDNQVLIGSTCTLISTGTERMMVDFGKSGWLDKARQQPEKFKQVLDKIRTDGLLPTMESVFNKLDEPMPMGYCNAGVVLEVGRGINDLQQGDRVASNGPHAEIVSIPRNLCTKIPDGVTNEEAAFTVLGSIALQGLRLAAPTFGEKFMVFGLGLIGLLTVQLLRANGCLVLAVDVNEKRLKLAETFGAKTVNLDKENDPVTVALSWTGGKGVDGAIIAASAKEDDIIHQTAQACRKMGRIILVGVVDLKMRRSDFYEKQLTFQVSCSYGPGRYDEKYEQFGQDYPLGFVRWTERRNFDAVLEAMRSGQLQVKDLITHRFKLEHAPSVYEKVLYDPDALGVVIQYPNLRESKEQHIHFSSYLRQSLSEKGDGKNRVVVGIIGAGNYARSILLPALARTDAKLMTIADINGVFAANAAQKFKAVRAVSDYRLLLEDQEINTVFILVGHHLHARMVCEALKAGKNVFVEKPLAINEKELACIEDAVANAPNQILMVGFNRRFSLHVTKIKELLEGRTQPICMAMTINAGYIPPEHWIQDVQRGGGRIIGEGCHFIDLLSYLAGSTVKTVSSLMVAGDETIREDKMSVNMGFSDGSIGTVHYFANGSKSYPKEILEIFSNSRIIRLENFRITKGYGFKHFRTFRTWQQDKGHRSEIAAFIEHVTNGGGPLISIEQLVNVTKTSFAAVESAKSNKIIQI